MPDELGRNRSYDGHCAKPSPIWAGPACREVTAHVVQVHGAIGFALESGIHRFYRRAESLQVWVDAVLAATA